MSMADPVKWVKSRALGKGSYGTVYVAGSNIPSHPLIAVKSSDLASSGTLQREDFILRDLAGCPEIVACFGSQTTVEDGGRRVRFNLLLEFARGGTLSDIIRSRGGRLSEPEIRCFTRMLLRGLRKIHAKGYVHCDLKPDNILAFPPRNKGGVPQLKIADFGLARFPGEPYNTEGRRFRGTPLYMSPESVGCEMIEPDLDMWSLGCVMIEMFAGRPAMECHDGDLGRLACDLIYMETMTALLPETMSTMGKDFLSKCLAIHPQRRWTADMLLQHPFVCDVGDGDGDKRRAPSLSRYGPPAGSSYLRPIVLDS